MSTTLNNLVIGAMRLINVVKANEIPSPDDLNIGLQAFDQMLDSWSNDKLMVYNTSEYIVYTKAGQQVYELGPCQNITGFNTIGYVPPGQNTSVQSVTLTNAGSSTLPLVAWNNETLTGDIGHYMGPGPIIHTPTADFFLSVNDVTGSPSIFSSNNGGVSYTQSPITVTGGTYGTGFFGGAFNGNVVAQYTNNNTIIVSQDHINWTSYTSPVTGQPGNMVYGNGQFVCGVNVTGVYSPFPVTPYIITSPDGITWTAHPGPVGIGNDQGQGPLVTLNGSTFGYMPTVFTNTTSFATSTDGNTWTAHLFAPASLPAGNYYVSSLMTNGTNFCITISATNLTYSYTSPDGITWTGGPTTITEANLYLNNYNMGTYVGGKYYLQSPHSNNCYISTDGINWVQSIIPGSTVQWYSISNNGSTVMLAGVYTSGSYAYVAYDSSYIPSYTGGTYPLTFNALAGTGAAGTYTISSITGSVSNVTLTSGGTGYTSAPSVAFSYGGINGATALASVPYASSAGINYVNGVYANVPLITLTGNGVGASATITVTNGSVSAVSVTANNIGPGDITSGGGYGYLPGDQVSASNIYLGGSGQGFAAVIASTTGGDWAMERPMRIEKAYTIWNDPTSLQAVDIPISKMNVEQWAALAVKNTPSTFGFGLYADNNYPITNVKLWPIPNQSTAVRLWLREPLVNFTNLNEVIQYPPGYERAFRFCLAVELAAEFGKDIPEIVLQTAITAKAELASLNAYPRYSNGDGGLSGRRKGFNWITGGFANWPTGASW
jgi:hypothetical protein